MGVVSEQVGSRDGAQRHRRQLLLGIAGSMLAELVIFVAWCIVLYPDGDLLTKFLWTVVFCGVGMGSAVGALLILFVADRLDGAGVGWTMFTQRGRALLEGVGI